ncbi:MAG: type transport system permease protein [Chloroflexota bacterium]|nr:type transport system permease protein [Chloroflexota bacterium]
MSALPPVSRAGNIYDLGYRRYEGPRLGRAHAIRSLVFHSFRTTFGIGRSGRAKAAPITFGAIAILPAVIIVGGLTIAARFGFDRQLDNAEIVGFNNYYSSVTAIIALFCAAQAPELFGRDQRHGVIALYFARALRRSDYALGRLLGFVLAILLLLLLPMVILFLGRVLLSTDIGGAFGANLPNVPPVVAQGLLIAGLYGSLAMAISAYTPRRAYATAGIIALFVLPGLVAGIVVRIGSSLVGTWLVLISPNTIIDGTNALFFGRSLGEEYFFINVPLWAFLVAAIAEIVLVVVLILRRFARLTI